MAERRTGPLRVAVLAMGWTGFNEAASRHLAARGVDLLIAAPRATPDTAFDDRLHEYAKTFIYEGRPDPADLTAAVEAFAPDAVLVHSWHLPYYRQVLKGLPAGTLRVLWMDNVWRNRPKQWLGRAVAPVWVRSLFDCVMVPSDRTEFFARRLGFGEGEVIRGSLSADSDLFGADPVAADDIAARRRFVACLRLVHHKGADILAEAYARYREQTDDPWDLDVVGIGPLENAFSGLPRVTLHGFLQPPAVAELMGRASCLVVPSREEPYGVVLHEGALSGLPIISTYFVGAAPFFVQDGQNGWVVPRADAGALATAMARMSAQPADDLAAMSAISRRLSARISSPGWARNVHEQLEWRTAALRAEGRS
ncbi:glycosyltransferase family 4 protein [Nocardioides albidus]|uniref:Glycosyltransferase family 4 protein n=1 Tax=Nocardioides albidus TaxID=1517589 RepID=A0A5C4W7E7_9ACTN|nr:glycosyltransferase family 4 protein [Nocardioides albidus]TNM44131.1 glycosyltransferase family 4 protein [Nocardioides albidus]